MATTPAFMALQRYAGDGTSPGNWVPTGFTDLSIIPDDLLTAVGGTTTAQDASGNVADDRDLQKLHFAPLRAFDMKAERAYSGTGSAAGAPSVSGRVDLADVMVERNVDKASPVLFEFCCSGQAFYQILIAFWQGGNINALTCVQLTGSNVSSYEMIGDRWFGQRFTTNRELQDTHAVQQKSFTIDGVRIEKVTFWYTEIGVESQNVKRGWDGSKDVPYEPVYSRYVSQG